MKLAIYALTLNGAKQARRLQSGLPFADLFVKPDFLEGMDAQPLNLPLSQFLGERFNEYEGHIFICATGIVTRVISGLIQDKRVDPAIVCVDEQANFVIPLLSGHRGGANALAERAAHVLKATPVITTASDVSGTIALDMLGAPFGWLLCERSEPAITPVSAAVVNNQPVAIVQQAGDKHWWRRDKRMPSNLICHSNLSELNPSDFSGAILISDEAEPAMEGWQNRLVLWRPKSLVLGLGCDRNTPLAVLQAGLAQFSKQFNLSLSSVIAFASIDLKADETGLLELSEQHQWPFHTYAPEQLDNRTGIENPSDYVKKVTGSNSVAEAAALALAQRNQLLVAKWAFKQDGFNMTVACCRKAFAEPLSAQKRKNWFAEKKHGSDQRHGEPVRINAHGSEVVPGYQCKPRHLDLNRPLLHHRHHIVLCEGARCAKAGAANLAHDLRAVLKDMGLASGNKRIKISRTKCVGACRNRATLAIYERSALPVNNGVWLRKVEAFSEDTWRTLFRALADGVSLNQVVDETFFAPIDAPQPENEPHSKQAKGE
ncbi:cobalamin biosynthesis protein [Reinekea marinisedimentorum]|uniref:Cobalt-precorrin 5A hydrolase n=1 Tax=Reinekea marinisedimentorum TaxID=230495 RepID=A0A4R3I0I3_9GAMM|nr:cobalamin biosynthesis protein [Reinekea marinisedimentorum]TCS39038.1 cobalt-precorrin 5A hydrolase [Reinekea marinisedimentorum]